MIPLDKRVFSLILYIETTKETQNDRNNQNRNQQEKLPHRQNRKVEQESPEAQLPGNDFDDWNRGNTC